MTPKFDLALTDDGLDSYRKAVKSLVNSCKKPKGLVDSKCGLNLRAPSGVTIKASNMSCSPSSTAALDRLKPDRVTLDSVRADTKITFTCYATGSNGARYKATNSLYSVTGVYTGSGWDVSST